MATGIYSGPCHFFLVESSHRELVVAGPAATADDPARGRRRQRARCSSARQRRLRSTRVGWPANGAARRCSSSTETRTRQLRRFSKPRLRSLRASSSRRTCPPRCAATCGSRTGEAEHRQVTAAFLKFTGVEALLAKGGPEAVSEPLAELGALVGRLTSELGITWLESDIDVDGGKLYLTAGAPSSTGADEEAMLRALRAILDADSALTLRAGVNRGPAFAGDVGASARRSYTVMGDIVNLAARLAARAEPGEILATGEMLERSRTRFETSPQPFLVKGKERAITAYSVGAHRGRGRGGTGTGALARRPGAGGRRAPGRARSGTPAPGPGRRARRRARDRQVAPRRGAEDDGRGLHPARHALRPVRLLRPVLPLPKTAAAAGRDHRGRERGRGRGASQTVGRGRDARFRTLAPAAGCPVRCRGSPDRGERRDRGEFPPRAPLRDGRAVPTSGPDDADASRRRGRALDGRRVARAPPASRQRARSRGPGS